ncbi:hypothetical protein [Micromonospora sp. IBSANI012]|uniref:hypothetical protein n=1 Tax=Micromonospora sp. IBSANI012 TaxID=3457761 RepID=UPI004057E65F
MSRVRPKFRPPHRPVYSPPPYRYPKPRRPFNPTRMAFILLLACLLGSLLADHL